MPTSETGEQPERKPDGRAILAGIALLVVFGIAWAVMNCGGEGDRRAVLRQVHEIEVSLRAHGPGFWVSVEGQDSSEHPDPVQEETHQAILRDFERLAHLEGFSMTGVEVQIAGDHARVSYGIRGVPRPGDALPAGGFMRFTRRGTKWRLVEHRLTEPPQARPMP